MKKQVDDENTTLRMPRIEDGSQIWALVKETQVLDVNASYTYLMLCRNFYATSVVAEVNQQVVGFLSAYIDPNHEQTLFIWQIGVKESKRGQGLATRMLHSLLQRDFFRNIRYIETTISPSNEASQALFRKLADHYNVSCEVSSCFETFHFPDQHERELLFTIGPFF